MNTVKQAILGSVLATLATLAPLHSASAWDHHHGYYGRGHYGGYYGGHYGGHYYRGHHGCRGCGSVGAAIAGLAIGTIIGTAIAPPPPQVVVAPPPPPPARCSSVNVNGVPYYNCYGGYYQSYPDYYPY